jgi:hypothetical protein
MNTGNPEKFNLFARPRRGRFFTICRNLVKIMANLMVFQSAEEVRFNNFIVKDILNDFCAKGG